jgi:predicted aspartyl protease
MGVCNWPLRLTSLDDQRSLNLDAMVDTGASYTIVPARLLRELGVEADR